MQNDVLWHAAFLAGNGAVSSQIMTLGSATGVFLDGTMVSGISPSTSGFVAQVEYSIDGKTWDQDDSSLTVGGSSSDVPVRAVGKFEGPTASGNARGYVYYRVTVTNNETKGITFTLVQKPFSENS